MVVDMVVEEVDGVEEVEGAGIEEQVQGRAGECSGVRIVSRGDRAGVHVTCEGIHASLHVVYGRQVVCMWCMVLFRGDG